MVVVVGDGSEAEREKGEGREGGREEGRRREGGVN